MVNQPTLSPSSSSTTENAPAASTSTETPVTSTSEPVIQSTPIPEQQNVSPIFDAGDSSSSDEEVETISEILNRSAEARNRNEASTSGTQLNEDIVDHPITNLQSDVGVPNSVAPRSVSYHP